MCLNIAKGCIFKPTIMFWPRACLHLNQRVSVHSTDHYRRNHMGKMLPRFNDMVDVSATFHVCGSWCRKSDKSFDVFSGKRVSDLAAGIRSIIILPVNTHSILLYMGKDSREKPPLKTNKILLKILKGSSSFFACFLIEMHQRRLNKQRLNLIFNTFKFVGD